MARTMQIACNLPHGLVLKLHTTRQTTPPQGGNPVTEYIPLPDRAVTINGLNATDTVRFGYAMTDNVDAEFWETWSTQNKDFPPFKLGHLFAFASPGDATAKAREMEGTKTGLEPIDPDKLPAGIEKADTTPTGRRKG